MMSLGLNQREQIRLPSYSGEYEVVMTEQAADRITINGSSHTMLTFPLDVYREKYRPDMVFYQASPNTGCWRGYIAEWEIEDGTLFLLNVDGYVSYKGKNPKLVVKDDIRWGDLHPELIKFKVPITLSELFGDVAERVPATWYSGELRFATFWDDLNYQTIDVTDGRCGELKTVGVINNSPDDQIPY